MTLPLPSVSVSVTNILAGHKQPTERWLTSTIIFNLFSHIFHSFRAQEASARLGRMEEEQLLRKKQYENEDRMLLEKVCNRTCTYTCNIS